MINKENFEEWIKTQGLSTYNEAFEKFLEQVAENVDPRDYMTPTQREIADLPSDALEAEYKMVQERISTRSAAQRKFITQRYEHETRSTTTEQDAANA